MQRFKDSEIAIILLAAGSGSRFRKSAPGNVGIAKQYMLLQGKPIVRHAAESLAGFGRILPVGDVRSLTEALDGLDVLPPIEGGKERQDSVRNGLNHIKENLSGVKYVLIHDSARPFPTREMITATINALKDYAGAVPVLPVTDTIKKSLNGETVLETVDRSVLWRAQTPQGFHFPLLWELHEKNDTLCSDDSMLLEHAGFEIKLVPGSEKALKITHWNDIMTLENTEKTALVPFVGTGFDVHAFAKDRPLILGGITIDYELGLAGHSDADVVTHTLCDAIYGALGEGDIGRHFPPTDEKWRNKDSFVFLEHAARRIKERGGKLVNADVTIICEQPKITPHAAKMQAKLAECLNVDPRRLSIKATTSERLGFTGRQEGIAALANVSVLLPDYQD